jgi:hypothetical protein
MSRAWRVASIASALALVTTPVAADGREVTARVEDQWRAAGARTTVLPARFLFDDETVLVPIPEDPNEVDGDCTQVAIVGARGLSFRARLSDVPIDPLLPPEPRGRGASTAGVLELRRCDSELPRVKHVVVTTEGGRGTVEVVVGRSSKPLPPLGALVPERTGGAMPAPAEAGTLGAVVPMEKRIEQAEARAKRDGAIVRPRTTVRAGADGAGEEAIELDEGCHRIEVFGHELTREQREQQAGRRFRLDVDAELRDSDRLLSRDRTEAPDARVETCVGSPTRVALAYAGSPPRSDVVITRATWPLPNRLPTLWGPATVGRMARVMLLRHVAVPADDPVLVAQGATGTTPVPMPVETGGCYVAVAAVARGHARQLQLRVHVGGQESTDERGATDEAALAAFCVRAHETPKLEVIARGTGVNWGLSVFRVKSGVWEAGR